MGDIEQLKATRKGKKSTVTKEIHAIEKFIAEEDIDEVYERLDKLKGYFKEFEEAHEAYTTLYLRKRSLKMTVIRISFKLRPTIPQHWQGQRSGWEEME